LQQEVEETFIAETDPESADEDLISPRKDQKNQWSNEGLFELSSVLNHQILIDFELNDDRLLFFFSDFTVKECSLSQ
jgi:hypothetical protein